ncbi:MAG: PAS domain-containing sensor histidine kinase [Balneolaceae bacterium]
MSDPIYKKIIENATDVAVFTMDLTRKIETWNSGAEYLLGWKRDEVIGKFGDIIFPEEGRSEQAEHEVKIASEEGSAIDEMWHIKKDGSRLWAVGRMMSIVEDSGDVTGYVKILIDQTEKKQYQQKLKEINETLEERVKKRTEALVRYQGRLRSLVSELNVAEERERRRLAGDLHDNLGQILAVCRMELDVAKKLVGETESDSPVDKAAGLVDDAIRYTRQLMSDLKPPDDVKENISRLMDWLTIRKKKYGLNVSVEDDRKPKPLRDDIQTALFQSVRELLFNVIKHSGTDEAKIILERLDEKVHITVEDRGKGFNPEKELERTEDDGFGLFNIREQFERFDATMVIDSEPGKGTKVTLAAPLDLEKEK